MAKKCEVRHLEKENMWNAVFVPKENVQYERNKNGKVEFVVEHKGFFDKIAQIIAKKPKISKIALDGIGTFVWGKIEEGKTVGEIVTEFKEAYPDEVQPEDRVAKFLGMLVRQGFICRKN